MFQNEQSDLPSIGPTRFENILSVHKTETNGFHFYNLLKTVRFNIDDMDTRFYYFHRVNRLTPYTILSHSLYGDMHLWWLICVSNNIDNPVEFIEPGSTLKIIKKQYVSNVISAIKQQLR